MDPDPTSSYLILIVLTVFSLILYCYFVMAAVAILRSSRSRLREMVGDNIFASKRARLIVSSSDKYLLTIQCGNLLSGLAIGILVFRIAEIGRVMFWTRVLGKLPTSEYEWLALLLLLFCASIVTLTAAQVVKGIAYLYPERVLCFLAYPLWFTAILLSPFVFILDDLIGSITKMLGFKKRAEREIVLSSEDLTELVARSTKAGEIDEEEKELIQGVFNISGKLVSEIMTPRTDVISVNDTQTLDEIVTQFVDAGFSRILVIGSELDDVKGVLLGKDLLPFVGKKAENFSTSDLLRKPLFVEGSMELDELLRTLREKAAHLAVVLDEHGGVDGVVTMEDLIEEIVGDIFDEHDSPEDREVEQTKVGEWLVDGGTILTDLKNEHDLHFPEGEYDTIAGFVIDTLGQIPDVGEVVSWNGATLTVEEVDQNRITLLKIEKTQ